MELEKYKLKCRCCNDMFISYNSKESFCSNKCKLEGYKSTCLNCNDKFYSDYPKAKYCCDWCRKDYYKKLSSEKNKYKKVNKNNYDEVVRFRVTELIERGQEGADNWRDRISLNYSNLGLTSKLKQEVLFRDKFECQICGKSTNIEIHHITKIIYGGDNSMENLIVLCTSCHRAIDALDIERAIRKCTKNAEKYLGIEEEDEYKDYKLLTEDAIYMLNRLYTSITKIDHDDIQEILIRLDDIITSIE